VQLLETILVLLLFATLLAALARRINVPYPTVLAVGGGIAAFIPGTPRLDLPPDLILALFVAPVLLDAAYDTSLRDLRRSWIPILSLVLVAVALTTLAVSSIARLLFPDLPWAAAVALGALLAPPDAVAALAVLRHVNPPHRIRMVLEGESLLNDASALLIYRLAVGAVAAGSFAVSAALPTFALVIVGSVVAGWAAARPVAWLTSWMIDAPSFVILQFVITFSLWLTAEHLGLSGVVTLVVFGLTTARRATAPTPARLRVPSFAIWETVTVVLNVLAFTLIGLQIRPILEALTAAERLHYLGAALVLLAVVVLIRFLWVLTHHATVSLLPTRDSPKPSIKGALVVGWSGMRGIVTLAAAMALPTGFPYRDFIQVAAFVVVVGTLVLQGLTLRPLLNLLRLPKDTLIESELNLARTVALKAAMQALESEDSAAAQRLRIEYADGLNEIRQGRDPRATSENVLRQRGVLMARAAMENLRTEGTIGDDAYRRIEEELDWLELSSQPRDS
jgi:CPA1 family monovalent cation:H+ antiporter